MTRTLGVMYSMAFLSNYSSQVRGPYTFNVKAGSNKFLFEECSDWPLIPKNYFAVIGPSPESGSVDVPIALGPDIGGDFSFVDNGAGYIHLYPLFLSGERRFLYLQLIVYYISTGNEIINKTSKN